jgi:hypothetical protein
MHEITCPHCNKGFKIDEAGYVCILKQVRDSEFEQQLHDRLELAETDKLNAVELAKSQIGSEMPSLMSLIRPSAITLPLRKRTRIF